jgi:hypothetical protein
MGENGQASLLLRKQLAELNKNPVEGFSAGLIEESDIFKWEVNTLSFKGVLVYDVTPSKCIQDKNKNFFQT